METKKKDKDYMAILDQPVENLKKPMDKSIDFGKVIRQLLKSNESGQTQ